MEKTLLQTYELKINVRHAYFLAYRAALEALEGKYKRDGIAPLERVLMHLLKLKRKGSYAVNLKAWRVTHHYSVATFLPAKPGTRESRQLIIIRLNDQELLGLPSLPEALVEALNTVRYDLYQKGIARVAAPSVEELLVAMVCYTAAVESRRWKHRVGLKFLQVER